MMLCHTKFFDVHDDARMGTEPPHLVRDLRREITLKDVISGVKGVTEDTVLL